MHLVLLPSRRVFHGRLRSCLSPGDGPVQQEASAARRTQPGQRQTAFSFLLVLFGGFWVLPVGGMGPVDNMADPSVGR